MSVIPAPTGCATGHLEQITLDHSLLQELVDRGYYTAEEAARAANKNYVTRALGVEPTVEVDVTEYPVQKGDVYMLCSDGLSDMLDDDDIEVTITTFGTSMDSVGRKLVEQANEAGGKDNISVVLAQVMETFPARYGIAERVLKWFS